MKLKITTLIPGKPNPNYYTDSGATFNKHLRTQNKLKSKQK